MKKAGSAATMLLAVLIGGCSSGLDQRYLDASLGQRLELPPDLIESEPESSFELPSTITGDDETVRDRVPVLAKVESLELQGSGNMYWLSVDEPVGNLYQMVKNFWSSEGYGLVVDEPAIGVMQTEWIYKQEGKDNKPDNWFLALFDSAELSATQDQFRTRIERGADGKNRIYIVHRGTEYQHVVNVEARGPALINPQERDSEWGFRQSEPELEVEMLSRLMLYLGQQQAEVDRQVSNLRLFAPRATMQLDSEENSPFLIIRDSYQIAWNRVIHHLERLNFEIETREFKSGLSSEGVLVVNTRVREKPQKGSFFSFGSTPELRERKIVLVLSEETHELTRLEIETIKGEYDTSPEGAEFLGLLYRQLR